MIHAQRLQPLQARVARRCCDYGRASALGELYRRDADAAFARLHQHCLSSLQVSELEQAIVSGAEWHWNRRGEFDVESLWHRPCVARGQRSKLCVRAGTENRGHLLPDFEIGYLGADFNDLA